jgi:hypothetical protein
MPFLKAIGLSCSLAAVAVLVLPRQVQGDTVVSIGTQHFADGSKPGTGTFNAAVAGQPAPFNGFIGSDITGPNFSGTWNYIFTPPSPIGGATLELGIYDHDSAAAGNQVASFTLNGTVDLTTTLNTAFEAHGGTNSEYDLYTITLPGTAFSALSTGSATFALTLQGPGLGVLGTTPFNGAGLDFATLDIAPVVVAAVPEPSTASLSLSAFLTIPIFWFTTQSRRARSTRTR